MFIGCPVACKQSFINFPGRTTIVIAHRLSTIRNADKIIAFHEGRKMEEGSHEDLLKIPDGVYANLINMQAGRQEKGDDEETVNQPNDADRPGRLSWVCGDYINISLR